MSHLSSRQGLQLFVITRQTDAGVVSGAKQIRRVVRQEVRLEKMGEVFLSNLLVTRVVCVV